MLVYEYLIVHKNCTRNGAPDNRVERREDAATTPWTIGSLLIPIGRFKRVGVVPTRRDNIGIFPAFFWMPMCTRVRIRYPFF